MRFSELFFNDRTGRPPAAARGAEQPAGPPPAAPVAPGPPAAAGTGEPPPDAPGQQPHGGRELRFLNPAEVTNTAKWAAGGFALLAGLLTFFGIKEGFLDRLLREEPDRALFVFLLVGLGVVASVLAPTFHATETIRVVGVLFVVAVLGGIATALGWDDPSAFRWAVTAVAFLALFVAMSRLRDATISLVAAALLLGVAATSMGLYSAATIAMSSKLSPDDPRLTATLAPADGRDTVQVAVASSKRENKQIVVAVFGHRGEQPDPATGTELGRATLAPDGSGEISATVPLPVVAVEWQWLTVAYCIRDDEDCTPRGERVRLRTHRGAPRVGARVVAGAKPGTAAVTVEAANIGPAAALDVRVVALRATAERAVYVARLVDGAKPWELTVPGLRPRDEVVVDYAVCAAQCPEDRTEVARFTVP